MSQREPLDAGLEARLWKAANDHATERGGFLPGDTIFAEAAGEIARLTRERDEAVKLAADATMVWNGPMAEENASLRAALKPFAKIGALYSTREDTDEDDRPLTDEATICLSDVVSTLPDEFDMTVGDFRRAAEAVGAADVG